MDKIEIKELTLEDIPDYVKVNTLAWQESYKGLIADSILYKSKLINLIMIKRII